MKSHIGKSPMEASTLGLSMDCEFALHAAAMAIRELDRDELEEAFIDMLHQKLMDRQLFLSILKEHGINADITFKLQTDKQLS